MVDIKDTMLIVEIKDHLVVQGTSVLYKVTEKTHTHISLCPCLEYNVMERSIETYFTVPLKYNVQGETTESTISHSSYFYPLVDPHWDFFL